MQLAILAMGIMAIASAITIIFHHKKRTLELEIKRLKAIAEIEEKINLNKLKHKEVAISTTTPVQDAIIHEAYKILEQRRKEKQQYKKWIYYATHARKFRVRKKYKNRIRKHYEDKGLKNLWWVRGVGPM